MALAWYTYYYAGGSWSIGIWLVWELFFLLFLRDSRQMRTLCEDRERLRNFESGLRSQGTQWSWKSRQLLALKRRSLKPIVCNYYTQNPGIAFIEFGRKGRAAFGGARSEGSVVFLRWWKTLLHFVEVSCGWIHLCRYYLQAAMPSKQLLRWG